MSTDARLDQSAEQRSTSDPSTGYVASLRNAVVALGPILDGYESNIASLAMAVAVTQDAGKEESSAALQRLIEAMKKARALGDAFDAFTVAAVGVPGVLDAQLQTLTASNGRGTATDNNGRDGEDPGQAE